MKPDAGGTIQAEVPEPGKVQMAVTPPCGCEDAAVQLELTPLEARLLGRWLLRLGNVARRG